MSLKLFRSTGYSSLLTVGERQGTMHPGWIVLVSSAWAGFVCNVALWRAIAGAGVEGMGTGQARGRGLCIGAASAVALGLLAWRRPSTPASTFVLITSALAASTVWGQTSPVDSGL